jgi:hypothetical protein
MFEFPPLFVLWLLFTLLIWCKWKNTDSSNCKKNDSGDKAPQRHSKNRIISPEPEDDESSTVSGSKYNHILCNSKYQKSINSTPCDEKHPKPSKPIVDLPGDYSSEDWYDKLKEPAKSRVYGKDGEKCILSLPQSSLAESKKHIKEKPIFELPATKPQKDIFYEDDMLDDLEKYGTVENYRRDSKDRYQDKLSHESKKCEHKKASPLRMTNQRKKEPKYDDDSSSYSPSPGYRKPYYRDDSGSEVVQYPRGSKSPKKKDDDLKTVYTKSTYPIRCTVIPDRGSDLSTSEEKPLKHGERQPFRKFNPPTRPRPEKLTFHSSEEKSQQHKSEQHKSDQNREQNREQQQQSELKAPFGSSHKKDSDFNFSSFTEGSDRPAFRMNMPFQSKHQQKKQGPSKNNGQITKGAEGSIRNMMTDLNQAVEEVNDFMKNAHAQEQNQEEQEEKDDGGKDDEISRIEYTPSEEEEYAREKQQRKERKEKPQEEEGDDDDVGESDSDPEQESVDSDDSDRDEGKRSKQPRHHHQKYPRNIADQLSDSCEDAMQKTQVKLNAFEKNILEQIKNASVDQRKVLATQLTPRIKKLLFSQ